VTAEVIRGEGEIQLIEREDQGAADLQRSSVG
jgi:hypothetical protein